MGLYFTCISMAIQAQTLLFLQKLSKSLSVKNRVAYNLKLRVTFSMTSMILKTASNKTVGWNRNLYCNHQSTSSKCDELDLIFVLHKLILGKYGINFVLEYVLFVEVSAKEIQVFLSFTSSCIVHITK
jgi:hypothetical protein